MKRIGPKMARAVRYVKLHPNCVMLWVAKHVGPKGSLQYGYRTVHRCLKAKLLVRTPGKGNSFTLSLGPNG